MLMKQVKLKEDNGSTMTSWIESKHAIVGRRLDLNLGDGKRSPVMTVTEVWDLEKDQTEVLEKETNRRSFGGSIH